MMSLMVAAICVVGCGEGSPDRQALHIMECDPETGTAKIIESVTNLQGTTYFQFSPDRCFLYSMISEKRNGRKLSAAVRFDLDDIGSAPKRLGELPCEAPCHIELSPDGGRLSFAAYTSATVSMLELKTGDVRSFVLEDSGMGPRRDRQHKAFAHCTFYTPDGKYMGVCDLGTDSVFFYDAVTLNRIDGMTVKTDPGDGPRHAFFRKDGKVLFVVNELDSSVGVWRFEGGRFTAVGKWSMLPSGTDKLKTKAAAVKLSADGKVLMASNRGLDSIAFFDVADDGSLSRKSIAPLKGKFPRDFELMPGGRFMVIGHKMSNEIQIYSVDLVKGTLAPHGDPIPAWRPLCFKFR